MSNFANNLGTGGTVRHYDLATGDQIFPFLGGLSGPAGMLFDDDNTLLVCNWGQNQILRYNATTGALIEVFAGAGDFLVGPSDIIRKLEAPVKVPAASTWGLIVMALLVGVAGTLQSCRRNVQKYKRA